MVLSRQPVPINIEHLVFAPGLSVDRSQHRPASNFLPSSACRYIRRADPGVRARSARRAPGTGVHRRHDQPDTGARVRAGPAAQAVTVGICLALAAVLLVLAGVVQAWL